MKKIYHLLFYLIFFLGFHHSLKAQRDILEPIPQNEYNKKEEIIRNSVIQKTGICELEIEQFEGDYSLYIDDNYEQDIEIKLDPDNPDGIIIYDIWTTMGTSEDSLFLSVNQTSSAIEITGFNQFIGIYSFDPSLGRVMFEDINNGLVTNTCNVIFEFIATPTLPESGYWWGGEFHFRLEKIATPVSETDSLSLIDLYNKSNGNNWAKNTNWLSTEMVAYWFGINVVDGEVKKINLSNNNLTDSIPNSVNSITGLTKFNVSNNKIENTTDFSGLASIESIDISNNDLDFDDLIPLKGTANFTKIIYSPQNSISEDTSVVLNTGESLDYSVTTYSDAFYQWYFNEEILIDDTTNSISITMDSNSEGIYHCEITHPDISGITLKSGNINLLTKVTEKDSLALAALYFYTNGQRWLNNTNWMSEKSINEWFGITTKNGRVTEINLANNNLTGSIPFEVFNLDSLEVLDIRYNFDLEGKIPEEIGNLTNLKKFHIYGFNLDIPDEIYSINSLEELSLYFVDGKTLSDNIGNLTNLKHLKLDNFEGEIPSTVGNLTNLEVLDIWSWENNSLLPEEIGSCTNLTKLEINGGFTGEIPGSLGNLTKLEELNLNSNNLTGVIPPEINNCDSLRMFRFEGNKIEGSLPVELFNIKNIEYIDGDKNNIEDLPEIPIVTNLSNIHLSGNKLTFEDAERNIRDDIWINFYNQQNVGEIIDTFLVEGNNFSYTLEVSGQYNNYSWYKNDGSIANTSPTLNITSFNENDSGEYYCKITNDSITNMVLYSEKIYINYAVNHSDSLALVALYNSTNGENWYSKENWFEEPVYKWEGITVKNERVTEIKLNYKNLIGHLPKEIKYLTELKNLELRINKIDSIPHELGELASLEKLDLYSNKIKTITDSISNLEKLMRLNLGFNDSLEYLPNSINHLTNLENLNIQGTELETLSDLSMLNNLWYLNVASNRLDFSELENVYDIPNSFYAYGQKFKLDKEDFYIDENTSFDLNFKIGGSANSYKWYKISTNEEILVSTDTLLHFNNFTKENEGKYYCKVTSEIVNDVEIKTEPVNLFINKNYDINFIITDHGTPIENADITINDNTIQTDSDGKAKFNLPNGGVYNYLVEKEHFLDSTAEFSVFNYGITFNLRLNAKQYPVTFKVFDEDYNPIENATIEISSQSGKTNSDGEAVFDIKKGTYLYTVSASGYSEYTSETTINSISDVMVVLSETTGINDLSNNYFNVYPNPTKGEVTIELDKIIDKAQIQICNLNGHIVLSEQIENKNIVNINLSNLPKGIYIIRIIDSNSFKTQRIIIH